MSYINDDIELLNLNDIGQLKYKAILQYMHLIQCLEKGIKIPYLNILEIISLIDIYSELENKRIYYKDYYLNGYNS